MIVGSMNELTRKNWLEAALNKIPEGLTILDAGAGELANKKFCTHLKYISQDFCQYEGQGNSKGLQTGDWNTSNIDIMCDITKIPLENSSMDVVLCSEVLEHVPSPEVAIKEFSRILKLNGTLILTAPFCSLTHFSPFHFSTGFNRYFYEHHLKEFGFEILEICENGNYFEYIGQEVRRLPEVADKYALSKLNFIEKFFLKRVLSILEKLSNRDNGSKEILCFGYGVVARKRH